MSDAEAKVMSSRRPSLRKLRLDVKEMREELEGGFNTPAEVLRWFQRLAVRTRGEIPQRRYHQVAAYFPPRLDQQRGEFLELLLEESSRNQEIEYDPTDLRRYFWAWSVLPAFHRAMRELRKDAGDYVGESKESQDAAQMRYIAMRPALDELDDEQGDVLDRFLEGFDETADVLGWGEDLQLATHGEPVQTDHPGGFATRLYTEGQIADQLPETSNAAILTHSDAAHKRAREWLAAKLLLPAFNRGVRDLAGRTGEEAATGDDGVADAPGWGGSA